MSDVIDYSVEPKNNPVNIGVTLSIDNLKVVATVTDVPDVPFEVKPKGNFMQKIISTILSPIADLVGTALKKAPRDVLKNKAYPLPITISAQTFSGITITPASLALGAHNVGNVEMVKITGDINLKVSS